MIKHIGPHKAKYVLSPKDYTVQFARSPYPWQHDKPLPRIFGSELFSVLCFLLPGPSSHLDNCHQHEKHSTPTPTYKGEPSPTQGLEHVIRTCDQIEPQTRWNPTFGASSGAKIAQSYMIAQIPQLSQHKQVQAGIREQRATVRSRGRRRTVDPVCHVETGQQPVMSRVLEDVEGWHGGCAESMHEYGLKLTLAKMDQYEGQRQRLQIRGFRMWQGCV